MDLERFKKLSNAKIEAGNITKQVRNSLKEYKHEQQNVQEQLTETYKPIIKAQEDIKQKIDEKQDKMLDQLQKNQLALTTGLQDLAMVQHLPDMQQQDTISLPIDYKPEMMKANIDKGFSIDEIKILTDNKLSPPSQVLNAVKNKTLDFYEYNAEIGEKLKTLGREKGSLSKNKKSKIKNAGRIDEITNEIKLIHKYRDRISIIPEGIETIGKGYKQLKRNAYKISYGGQYGNLIIDIPRLMGQLHLVANKNGNTVLDKKVDFDTIDLLTKRFNSKKNYSDLSKMVFNQLNKLSEIPIHKSSKKFSKIGNGVVYYNDTNDLINRLELLGGSILAGNNGVKDEFTNIVHKLYQLGVIDNENLNELLKVYVI